MNRKTTLALSLTLALSVGSAYAVGVGEVFNSEMPGSVLVFPKFEIEPLTATQIRISNDGTGADVQAVWGASAKEAIVHLVYVCGQERVGSEVQQRNCDAGNRTIRLTPKETWVVDVNDYFHPVCDEGYVIAYAIDSSGAEVNYNYLKGSYHIDKLRPLRRSAAQAISIQAPEGGAVNGNGVLEFDGNEFANMPNILDTDFRATEFAPLTASDITLLTLDINAGDANFPTSVGLDWWNQAEEPYSSTHSFYCWDEERLDQIDPNFRANFMGSTHGLLQITPRSNNIPDDPEPTKTILGAIREVGGGYHTIRNLYHDNDPKSTAFVPDTL